MDALLAEGTRGSFGTPRESFTEEPVTGRGIYNMKKGFINKNKRVIFGRGLVVQEEKNKFLDFGKFKINKPSLEKGYLSLKYKSCGIVTGKHIVLS